MIAVGVHFVHGGIVARAQARDEPTPGGREARSAGAGTPTTQEIADFWNVVFDGPDPYGVPPLNAIRFNQRTLNNCTIWDVRFDSYKDPETGLPVRLGGIFAVPNSVPPPGPGGTFPGLVVTHSVGTVPPAGPGPDDVASMSTWFALKGFAALAFYMRGWGTSPMSVTADLFTDYLADENGQPLDYRFTGMAVDNFQAGEFVAAQPEVWDPDRLTIVGHSGGGFAALAGGVFSDRFKIICASAPAAAWPDSGAWLDYVWGNGGFLSIQTWVNGQPDPAYARSLVERSLTFVSMYHVIDNPFLSAWNAAWGVNETAIFFYGGQADTAIPPWDVAANFELADPSSPELKAFHWSPTGGHGGPESWNRTQAWVAGHYPGVVGNPPVAALSVTSINGASVGFSSAGNQVWEYDWNYSGGGMTTNNDNIVSWDYDFGDGTTMNWGPGVSHTYALAGNYVASLTITDGAGVCDGASVPVTVTQGSGSNAQLQVVADNPEVVPEGQINSFLVRLTEHPEGNVTVLADRTGGDASLSVSGGAGLVFTPGNWNAFQIVTLTATPDADRTSNSAVFSVSAPMMTTVNVNARERDDDAEFVVMVGDVVSAAGNTISAPVTLVNSDAAPVGTFSVSLSFDGTVLVDPSAVRGLDLPGPAWWEFSAEVPGTGLQVLAGSEFVQPDDPVINGIVAQDSFAIPPGAPPGVYRIAVDAASVNGQPAAAVEDGFITITSTASVPAIANGGLAAFGVLVILWVVVVSARRERGRNSFPREC
ncbi:MAG: prolyl oligopeptidase family serine peptidase [Phycisphaerales bacterium]|nr:prolyl oligopeptidase family serine peptidase [Phycisphaerales bacterium]